MKRFCEPPSNVNFPIHASSNVPNVAYWAKIFVSISERISYERRDYESVDVKSLL